MNQPRIYMASKTKHAARWRELRSLGRPIISTWIDDAVDKALGGAVDRCIGEASTATALIVYVEPDEVLSGAYVEVGAALARGIPVFLVGDPPGTCWHHRLATRCASVDEAFRLALGVWVNAEAEPPREALGRRVREVWIAWAKEQPSPKASWLVLWDQLSEPDREVDRRIGETIASEVSATAGAEIRRLREALEAVENIVRAALALEK